MGRISGKGERMSQTHEEIRPQLEELFQQNFGIPGTGAVLASAPGRIELAGNHTDHQGGHTISAGLDRRIYGLACPNGSNTARVWMDGFGHTEVNLDDLSPVPGEVNSSTALIRGMAAAYAQHGGQPVGFDAVVISEIPVGCGVSSSAAFEVLMGALIRETAPTGWPAPSATASSSTAWPEPPDTTASPAGWPDEAATTDNDPLDFRRAETLSLPHQPAASHQATPTPDQLVQLALDGQFAEAHYFGKPTGAQDQLASTFGGIVGLDFSENPPRVTPISADFAASNYALMLIDSRCDHSRYTAQFNSIPADMLRVAALFGKPRLGDVGLGLMLARFPEVRAAVGDLPAMRAIHYFNEDARVQRQAAALQEGNFAAFVQMAGESGASSAMFLQNVSPQGDDCETDQPAMVIQALCAAMPGEEGAWRIHGGGFGGSVLAFVPNHRTSEFTAAIDRALGYPACHLIAISPQGLLID